MATMVDKSDKSMSKVALGRESKFVSGTFAPSILIGLGFIYLVLDFRSNKHNSHSH